MPAVQTVEMDEHVSVDGGCERIEPDVDHEEALQVDRTDKQGSKRRRDSQRDASPIVDLVTMAGKEDAQRTGRLEKADDMLKEQALRIDSRAATEVERQNAAKTEAQMFAERQNAAKMEAQMFAEQRNVAKLEAQARRLHLLDAFEMCLEKAKAQTDPDPAWIAYLEDSIRETTREIMECKKSHLLCTQAVAMRE